MQQHYKIVLQLHLAPLTGEMSAMHAIALVAPIALSTQAWIDTQKVLNALSGRPSE